MTFQAFRAHIGEPGHGHSDTERVKRLAEDWEFGIWEFKTKCELNISMFTHTLCYVQYRRPNGWVDRAHNLHKHSFGTMRGR
jgi:hypothetical protein